MCRRFRFAAACCDGAVSNRRITGDHAYTCNSESMRSLRFLLIAASSVGFSHIASAQSTYEATASHANPDGTTEAFIKRCGPCGDPWVTMALERVFGKADAAKCNVGRYNNGRWSSYNELS